MQTKIERWRDFKKPEKRASFINGDGETSVNFPVSKRKRCMTFLFPVLYLLPALILKNPLFHKTFPLSKSHDKCRTRVLFAFLKNWGFLWNNYGLHNILELFPPYFVFLTSRFSRFSSNGKSPVPWCTSVRMDKKKQFMNDC